MRFLLAPLTCALIVGCGPTPVDADDAGASPADASVDAGAPIDAGADVDAGAADAGPLEALDAGLDGGSIEADAGTEEPLDAGTNLEPCRTRITYGAKWIKAPSHTTDFDDVNAAVTWDGACTTDSSGNSFATLSNGWKPYFTGRGSCVINLEQSGSCATAAGSCRTRISYGSTWLAAPNHPNRYDDQPGIVSWDGVCRSSGANSVAQLSNGWGPTFSGGNACDVSLRYQQCGGLYANPVLDVSCPDPGVMKAGNTYYMACTSGGSANAYPLRKSTDLVHWTSIGSVMPSANKPSWATGDFWAPELHKVGNQYVAYFSARHTNGIFAIGAAVSAVPQGPYQAQPAPLIHPTSNPGVIDVHFFEAPNGDRYLLWKPDSNAQGNETSIKIRKLAADGLSFTGAETTLITSNSSWEGIVVEGPWMIFEGGYYYLFYSGNGYASTAYAIGVARSTSPTGPFTKSPDNPILVTRGAWAGPGHGSVVRGPSGDWVHVYHSWEAGHVNDSPGRLVLVDRLTFSNGWPEMLAAPSSASQPLP